jgi:hypothetical protein
MCTKKRRSRTRPWYPGKAAQKTTDTSLEDKKDVTRGCSQLCEHGQEPDSMNQAAEPSVNKKETLVHVKREVATALSMKVKPV